MDPSGPNAPVDLALIYDALRAILAEIQVVRAELAQYRAYRAAVEDAEQRTRAFSGEPLGSTWGSPFLGSHRR